MNSDIQKLLKLIIKSKKILLINHIRMDMDAFASLCALYSILKDIGTTVKAINDERPMKSFNFLGYDGIINPNLNIKEYQPDLIISLDAGSIDRLGKTYSENVDLFQNTNFVVIDHHPTNKGFGDLNLVNSKYSSTSEYLYDILSEMKLVDKITPKIATALISGIYTDTNIFYNTNVTKNTYNVVANLIEKGADYELPYYELYKKKTFIQSKLWGEILANNFNLSENGKYSWAIVKKEVFEKLGASDRDLGGLISEFFINTEGVKISFLCYETIDGSIKVSFRSKADYDISVLTVYFGGGGHKQAGGFTSTKKIKEVEKDIIKQIKKEFNF